MGSWEFLFPIHDSLGNRVGVLGIVYRGPIRRLIADVSSGDKAQWKSPAMWHCLGHAERAAAVDTPVLLTGETGSGKDWLATWIHSRSQRSDRPFFQVNCAAISPELAESELFGHTATAFTGAKRPKRGLLELAEDGTLLLNEIGDLSLDLQAKLLTFLDYKTFIPVGGQNSITVSARIIAATNRNLEEQVSAGRFRKDLFFRLNKLRIEVPPLRERIEDVPLLVSLLLHRISKDRGLESEPGVVPAAMEILCEYPWEGNIRELANILEKAVTESNGATITPGLLGLPDLTASKKDENEDLKGGETVWTAPAVNQEDVKLAVDRFHRLSTEEQGRYLKIILDEVCGRESGSKGILAKVLGLSPPTINKRLKLVGGVKLKTGNPTAGARERLLRLIQEYLVDHIPK